MALTIVVRSGEGAEHPEIAFDSPRIVIGRGEGCEVRLPDPSVSHRHASIRQRGTDYIVLDEGSTNGTFVGPVRLSPQTPRVLRSGDLIRVGRIWLEARVEPRPATPQAQLTTKEIALRLVADALGAQGEPNLPRVTVTQGPDQGAELTLAEFEHPYVVGRGAGVELRVEDADASRRHVEIVRRGDTILARDLGSKNGSLLGGEPLGKLKPRVWKAGQLLQAGQNVLSASDPVAEALAELEHSADEPLLPGEPLDAPNLTPKPSPSPPLVSKERVVTTDPPSASVTTVPPRFKTRRKTSITTTDALVALLAFVVLALSFVGLFWLF